MVSGRLKNRNIFVPKGVRPTSSRLRKVIISSLKDFIPGAKVLDLFAGSGALGIETLSSGAFFCDFVDIRRKCVAVLYKNLSFLGISENSRVHLKDSFRFIKDFARKQVSFDIIFADPPYYHNYASKFLKTLDECDILSPSGVVVLQVFVKDNIFFEGQKIRVFSQKRRGQDLLLFFERIKEDRV